MKKKDIGTKNESSLHRTLKFQYTGAKGKTEVTVGEFIADGLRADGEYIEVQTGSFAPLIKKIETLITANKKTKIRIIHPIALNKYIEVYRKENTLAKIRKTQKNTEKKTKKKIRAPSHEGKLLYRRKSPKKGSIWSLFDALIYAPELALLRGVSIEAVLVDVTEKRLKDGKGSWRRRGVSIKDKELCGFYESVVFKKPSDFLLFMPFKKKEQFTVKMLAERKAINKITARKALYVLAKMKIVDKVGKSGNYLVYERR